MSVSEREIEPSTLPQGIGRMTAAYTLFIAIDPMLFWQVIGHFCSHIDGVDLSSNVVLGVGAVIGIVTALNFIWFPLLLLDGRTPVAVAAFRKLCILIGPVHILLVTIVLVNAAAVGFGDEGVNG
ncbi:hypothetical protein [Acidiphilium acidophilum]|uniref:hypothetical protein n=1 Tax=Acidiphilium acidophilum TaxID=76588 RepID=UPI002E8E68F8|nr:hypothetical protein [Acidiphilium acidophilum]